MRRCLRCVIIGCVCVCVCACVRACGVCVCASASARARERISLIAQTPHPKGAVCSVPNNSS